MAQTLLSSETMPVASSDANPEASPPDSSLPRNFRAFPAVLFLLQVESERIYCLGDQRSSAASLVECRLQRSFQPSAGTSEVGDGCLDAARDAQIGGR